MNLKKDSIYRILIFIFLLIAGCAAANPYRLYYVDYLQGKPISILKDLDPQGGEPKILSGTDEKKDSIKLCEDNYSLIGVANFKGPPSDLNLAREQAASVQADIVVVYSQSPGTDSGSSQATTPGQYRDSSISPAARVFDQKALFWVKRSPPILGAVVTDLTPKLRKKFGSDQGVLVIAVVNDSPASDAHIIRGDILKNIGKLKMNNIDKYEEAIEKYSGNEVKVTIIRENKEIVKKIKFGEPGIKKETNKVNNDNIKK